MGENPGRPAYPRPAWHPYTPSHDFDPGAMSGTQMYLSRGLDVGLIVWTERLAQGSKDPQLSAKPCPSQQSTPWSNHKRQDTTSVERRANMSQREAGRPGLVCVRATQATPTAGGNHRRSHKGSGQMATILGRPAPPCSHSGSGFAWKLSTTATTASNRRHVLHLIRTDLGRTINRTPIHHL